MNRLKFERIKRGWSQTTLAYLAKLPQPVICLIETGRQNPTAAELDALGHAFGIAPPSVLLKEVTVVDPDEEEGETPSLKFLNHPNQPPLTRR